jgi:hypothetical protein
MNIDTKPKSGGEIKEAGPVFQSLDHLLKLQYS